MKRKIWAIAYADLRDPAVDIQYAYQQACDRVKALVQKLQMPLSNEDTVLEWNPPNPRESRQTGDGKATMLTPAILPKSNSAPMWFKSQGLHQSWGYFSKW